jgi:hypothetical protein
VRRRRRTASPSMLDLLTSLLSSGQTPEVFAALRWHPFTGSSTNTIHPAWRSRCSLTGADRAPTGADDQDTVPGPADTTLFGPCCMFHRVGGCITAVRVDLRRRRCEASRARADARGRSPGAAAKALQRHCRVTDLSQCQHDETQTTKRHLSKQKMKQRDGRDRTKQQPGRSTNLTDRPYCQG